MTGQRGRQIYLDENENRVLQNTDVQGEDPFVIVIYKWPGAGDVESEKPLLFIAPSSLRNFDMTHIVNIRAQRTERIFFSRFS